MVFRIFSSAKRVGLAGLCALCLATIIIITFYSPCSNNNNQQDELRWISPQRYMVANGSSLERNVNDTSQYFAYGRDMPLVFIGGMPRSGTTLLRVMLDAHPDVRCGGETRVIPRILNLRNSWLKAPFESQRLLEAGITPEVLDSAISAFMLEIIAKHGKPAKRLCNKDPFTLKSAVYIRQLFPNAKFLFLIRDGRAVVHSIVSRKVTISGFNIQDYRQCLTKWNSAIKVMYEQCRSLNQTVCLPVYYEQLVLHPKKTIAMILKFLDLPWNETTLHHEKLINQPEGISLSKLERSTDQVIKPVNTEALTKWAEALPSDVVRDMESIAPMLATLGYDPNKNPPNYGNPDSFVLQKEREIEKNLNDWKVKEQLLINQRESLRRELTAKQTSQQSSMDQKSKD
ncbi:Protein-tyrosine sulfotransferase 2, partial [Fragariocoptes setiger]